MRNEGTNDGWEGNTCPIPVLPVFSEGDSVLIKTKFEVLRVNELNQEIWSVLRFADGLVTVEELVRLASSACGEPPETLRAVVRDLFTLGVLRDSRRLFTTQMELTERVSDCLCAEGLVYKYSANRLGYATAEVSGFLCVRLLL